MNIRQIREGLVTSVKGEFELAAICRDSDIKDNSLFDIPRIWLEAEVEARSENKVSLFSLQLCPVNYGGVNYVEAYVFTDGLNNFLTIMAPPKGASYGFQILRYNNPMSDWCQKVVEVYLTLHARLNQGKFATAKA